MGGLPGYAAADLHCRSAGGSERADSGGAASGPGSAWVDHGYIFDAAGRAGLDVGAVTHRGLKFLLSATARAPLTMIRIFSTRHLGTLNISKVQRVFGFQQMRK